ncbi:MAG: aminotransferase class V-fold PLP-dependent enzyme [Clostridia bacterium]|nr:aminotransferase class V-fold PLP-dependent enzyme [Clostridia bacterium]
MIYLDNAATTYPKPLDVRRATDRAFAYFGANPGRGGYPMAIRTSEEVYRCRETAAAFFGVADERQVIFTSGCTEALNIVINSLLASGGRAVVSDLEHNAVIRPLHALSPNAPIYDIAHVTPDDEGATVEAFRRAMTPRTCAVVCTHASNVTGTVLPITRIAAAAHERGIPIVVDAAQSAGHLAIDMEEDGLDYVCAAGHKGLCGPMGTGLLLCRRPAPLVPLVRGGTGSQSLSPSQPEDYPERLESGTPNVAGICGLRAGMAYIAKTGVAALEEREHRLHHRLYDGLADIRGICLRSPPPRRHRTVAVLSLTVEGQTPDTVGERLAREGVAVRTGLHCAPLAHRAIGTLPDGTVRLSIGAMNSMKEIEECLQIFKKIVQ